MNENRRETFFIAFSKEHECEIENILLLFTIFLCGFENSEEEKCRSKKLSIESKDIF